MSSLPRKRLRIEATPEHVEQNTEKYCPIWLEQIVRDADQSSSPTTFRRLKIAGADICHPNEYLFPLTLGNGFLYRKSPHGGADRIIAQEALQYIMIGKMGDTTADEQSILARLESHQYQLAKVRYIWVEKWLEIDSYIVLKVHGYSRVSYREGLDPNPALQRANPPELAYLPDSELLKRLRRCRLLSIDGLNWPYISTLSNSNEQSDLDLNYTWDATGRIVKNLPKDWDKRHQPIMRLPTLHRQPGYAGFFRPTVREVLSQLPAELFTTREQNYLISTNTCCSFIRGDLQANPTFITDEYHLGITKVYLDNDE